VTPAAGRGLLARILPSCVAVLETFADLPQAPLFPAARALLGRSVAGRAREFTTARHCAHQALRALGLPAVPITRDRAGAPVWPPSVLGSITHCTGYRAAAVAPVRCLGALGIDAEPDRPLPAGMLAVIAGPAEVARVRELEAAVPAVAWGRLLFSAKEAVYKAWYPAHRSPLAFHAVDVLLDPQAGTFSARLAPSPACRPVGRWLAADGLLLTSVTRPSNPEVASDPRCSLN
jgi:4'-phosphopantetheinyl transferase EntD